MSLSAGSVLRRVWVFGLPFLSSLLLLMAFLLPDGNYLIFIALVPLFLFVTKAVKQSIPAKKIVVTVWLSGLAFFLAQLSWILQLHYSLGEVVDTPVIKIMTVVVWLVISLIFSLSYLLFGWLITRRQDVTHRLSIAFVFVPAAWVINEYLRGWLYSIVQWAPDATLGPHWNFGALGLAAIDTPISITSRIVGLYGLGAIVIVVNLTVFFILSRRYKAIWLALPLLALWLLSGCGYKTTSSQALRVEAIQLGNEQAIMDSEVSGKIQAAAAANDNTQLVILPEYPFLYQGDDDTRLAETFSPVQLKPPAVIVYSRYAKDNDIRTTDIVFSDKQGSVLFKQKKYFLVPSGEYLPVYYDWLLSLLGHPELKREHQSYRYIQKANSPEVPFTKDGLSIGALSCSGVMSTEFYRNLSNQGAQILTNSASLESFRDAPFYFKQSRQMAKFQAIANAKPFIQAARAGRSYIIDYNGKIVAETLDLNAAIVKAEVPLSQARTLYSRIGEIFVALAAVIVLGFVLAYYRNKQ